MAKGSNCKALEEPRPPRLFTPWVKIPQPDGAVLFKPGKPIEIQAEITVKQFAGMAGLSCRRVQYLCDIGEIKCRRATSRLRSKYLIPLTELDRFLNIRDT